MWTGAPSSPCLGFRCPTTTAPSAGNPNSLASSSTASANIPRPGISLGATMKWR